MGSNPDSSIVKSNVTSVSVPDGIGNRGCSNACVTSNSGVLDLDRRDGGTGGSNACVTSKSSGELDLDLDVDIWDGWYEEKPDDSRDNDDLSGAYPDSDRSRDVAADDVADGWYDGDRSRDDSRDVYGSDNDRDRDNIGAGGVDDRCALPEFRNLSISCLALFFSFVMWRSLSVLSLKSPSIFFISSSSLDRSDELCDFLRLFVANLCFRVSAAIAAVVSSCNLSSSSTLLMANLVNSSILFCSSCALALVSESSDLDLDRCERDDEPNPDRESSVTVTGGGGCDW